MKIFTTIDSNFRYFKVEIDKDGRNKTNFTSQDRIYRTILILFGLKNCPGTFKLIIDVILSTAKWKYALVYLEDIVFL